MALAGLRDGVGSAAVLAVGREVPPGAGLVRALRSRAGAFLAEGREAERLGVTGPAGHSPAWRTWPLPTARSVR